MRSVSEALRAHEVSEAEYVSGPSVPGAGRAPGKVDGACDASIARGADTCAAERLECTSVADVDSMLMRDVLL